MGLPAAQPAQDHAAISANAPRAQVYVLRDPGMVRRFAAGIRP
jgi:hypothetical protein